MERLAARAAISIVSVLLAFACSSPKPVPQGTTSPSSSSTLDAGPPTSSEPPEPFPATKEGAAWTVVGFGMSAGNCTTALEETKLSFERRSNPKSSRLEAIDVASDVTGWKATIGFDDGEKVKSVIVRGDSVTIESARAERARLEKRFGIPKETSFHRSRQWETKAVEISGDRPSWRVTQSLLRSGDKKDAVAWPSVSPLSFGMSVAQATAAIKAAGFVPEKVPAPPKPKPKRGKKPKPEKPILPPNAPRGAKLIELTFKKGEEHVLLALLDKTGLFKVAIGEDVGDRTLAEQRARELAKDLGAALSEAETETSVWEDPNLALRLSITGFQGQRIVVERFFDPKSDADDD